MKNIAIAVLVLLAMRSAAYQSMYEATTPGEVEVKEIPRLKALQASGEGDYFKAGGSVFMKLFRYIDENKVNMTVPVESDVAANRMRFFVGTKDQKRELTNTKSVVMVEQPERVVASVGIRGGYTRENYDEGLKRLNSWLEERAGESKTNGAPYAVYWNSPVMPGFLKKSEIHVPVVPVEQD